MVRTHVTFRHPAEFVQGPDGILGVDGAHWFLEVLLGVPELLIDDLVQEDWGVVFRVRREGKKFWIGLGARDAENGWVAHLHRAGFAWLQWLSAKGNRAFRRLLNDLHAALLNDPAVSEVLWYEAAELDKPRPTGFATPL